MRLSTRNQLKGTITEVDLGTVMAVVKVKLDAATRSSPPRSPRTRHSTLGLTVGQSATVFIKSTEVTIGVE